jgi:uncharacterized protein
MTDESAPFRGLPAADRGAVRVRFSRRWLVAGGAAALTAAGAVAAGGLPAALVLAAAAALLGGYATAVEPARPQLRRRTIRLAGLPPAWHGLTIGHLSDLHLGHPFTAANLRWAVAQLQQEAVDLIALTGDLVQQPTAMTEIAGLLAPLRAPLGIYAVPGNHDYWEGLPALQAALADLPIEWLINRHVVLQRGAAALVLAGIDDHWDGSPDLRAAFAGAPADAVRLLLAHCPDVADAAATCGAQLQLSGHTHGGHLRLPGFGPLALPRYGWRYHDGVYDLAPLTLTVSRGIGGAPLRLGCAPELVLLRIECGD